MRRICQEQKRDANGGFETIIEGELGYIGQSSQVLSTVPVGVQLTDPADAKRFAAETGIDLLAPAVGNFHGMLEGDRNLTFAAKKISPERIREISRLPACHWSFMAVQAKATTRCARRLRLVAPSSMSTLNCASHIEPA